MICFFRKYNLQVCLFFLIFTNANQSLSQCCAGGSGSPLAGGASQGVLQENQFEINTNYQHISTKKFLTGTKTDKNFLDYFGSNYLFTRFGYGVNEKFTMSVDFGYFINKKQIGLYDSVNKTNEVIKSGGFGDIILFPRYDIYNKTKKKLKTEITIGLGVKIPLGKYNDSFSKVEPFSGEKYYITMPLAVQPSSGSHDILLYGFFLKEFKKFKSFVNITYIKKGWNSLGEKQGNYMSVGFFASKTLVNKLGLTAQVKYEFIDKMKINKNVLLYDYPNYDPAATGSKKIFIVPQLNYTFKGKYTVFALSEIPIYQYVNKTQIASQFQFSTGISYRFYMNESEE
ncbi:MAG: hypothetical protein IT243_11430 [Bacteroidia bacterium]|nr:hypothetical protein [Bacteroidia bacterium]